MLTCVVVTDFRHVRNAYDGDRGYPICRVIGSVHVSWFENGQVLTAGRGKT